MNLSTSACSGSSRIGVLWRREWGTGCAEAGPRHAGGAATAGGTAGGRRRGPHRRGGSRLGHASLHRGRVDARLSTAGRSSLAGAQGVGTAAHRHAAPTAAAAAAHCQGWSPAARLLVRALDARSGRRTGGTGVQAGAAQDDQHAAAAPLVLHVPAAAAPYRTPRRCRVPAVGAR